MKISFVTLGCKLNYAETSTYERKLLSAGCESVSWTSGKADAILVNTCTVTEHSDKKCRNVIRKLHRLYPAAPIVVTGCYAQMKKEEILSLEGVDSVFGANEKSLVAERLTEIRNSVHSSSASICSNFFPAYSSGERTRSFLKVQDGCNNFCTYCTVPYARGESRNIPVAEIIPQAREIAAQGIKEVVLTGVNTGDFGRSTGENFLDLIKALNEVEGIERYRISSIEPNLLTDEICDWIASGTKFLPHFHIPLQSGCDAVLKEMGRKYSCDDFAKRIEYIRQAMEGEGKPKVFFGIDVIVGFPGETEEMFNETYRFLEQVIRPSFIHIFPYSKRAGTPAATRKDQVQDSIKTQRVQKLEELCSRLHDEFTEAHKGIELNVLFESTDKKGMMSGYSENYIQVSKPYDRNLVGQIVKVKL